MSFFCDTKFIIIIHVFLLSFFLQVTDFYHDNHNYLDISIRIVVVTAIEKYKSEKENAESIEILRRDVLNSIYYFLFLDYSHSHSYHLPRTVQKILLYYWTFWCRMKSILQSVISKSRSLVEDIDTNVVKCFNSVVAKIVGGKRINFSFPRGYRARSALLQFWLLIIWYQMFKFFVKFETIDIKYSSRR